MTTVQIDYFSDILCVWAYIGHARTNELQTQFPNQLAWTWHYLPVFGDAPGKWQSQWQDRGGVAGYAKHVEELIADFDHVQINPDCWATIQPPSSAPAHLWLAAARIAEQNGELPVKTEEGLAWALRKAFFEEAIDIAKQSELISVCHTLGLDSKHLLDYVTNGTAYAALCHDMLKARDANIRVSPTFVFNDGRQQLTGNVGYRIIEANIKELIEHPEKQQSWC